LLTQDAAAKRATFTSHDPPTSAHATTILGTGLGGRQPLCLRTANGTTSNEGRPGPKESASHGMCRTWHGEPCLLRHPKGWAGRVERHHNRRGRASAVQCRHAGVPERRPASEHGFQLRSTHGRVQQGRPGTPLLLPGVMSWACFLPRPLIVVRRVASPRSASCWPALPLRPPSQLRAPRAGNPCDPKAMPVTIASGSECAGPTAGSTGRGGQGRATLIILGQGGANAASAAAMGATLNRLKVRLRARSHLESIATSACDPQNEKRGASARTAAMQVCSEHLHERQLGHPATQAPSPSLSSLERRPWTSGPAAAANLTQPRLGTVAQDAHASGVAQRCRPLKNACIQRQPAKVGPGPA
jgi:hypothetical protein